MIQCEASKAAERLLKINMQQVTGAGKDILFKLVQIRNMKKSSPLSELKEEKVRRFSELISLTFGIPYETESLLFIAEIEVIRDLLSETKKSIAALEELDNAIVECEESDSDFYRQYALFALDESQVR
ncbi:MAG: hypothetical protein ACLSTI_02340 [Ruminococcus sp.]